MLLVPLVLAGVHIKTLPVAMIDFFTFERELDWSTAAAALIVSLVPLTLLVAVGYRLLDRFSLGATQR
jgi:ABC-type glycerol-3-phosphate transport system permease component